MNICLITSTPSGADFKSPVLDELADLGVRIVVLFLEPQQRVLWNRQNIVFYAPLSNVGGLGGVPLEAVYRQRLDAVRKHWLAPIKSATPGVARILQGIERRGFRIARAGGSRVVGRLESAAAVIRQRLSKTPINPLENLPQGIGAYGVVQALDAASISVAKEAAAAGGAQYFGPAAGNVKAAYEQAIMHWLKA